MPHSPDLTITQINELWAAQEQTRVNMTKRIKYFNGEMDITGQNKRWSDGNPKSEPVTNWIATIIKRYVGALTMTPWQVTRDDPIPSPEQEGETPPETPEETDVAGIQAYGDLEVSQSLRTKDGENLQAALLTGYGIEVHSWDSGAKEVQITVYDPREWVIVLDTMDVMTHAIRRVELPAGTIHQVKQDDGTFQNVYFDDPVEIQTVYTDTEIITYELKPNTEKASTPAAGAEATNQNWEETDRDDHKYGQVPVVEWRADPERDSIISEAIMGQNDAFNTIDGAAADDIIQRVNAILKIIGVDPAWIAENAALIQEKRVLPIPAEGGADYLIKPSDTEPTQQELARIRSAIHLMGAIPDVAMIVGTTGATSGIALKLMFTPMAEAASVMIPYLEQGMRRRIDLINAMHGPVGKPLIENYTVVISFSIPANHIEEWQNIGALDGIVSQATQLELLQDIKDPERELAKVALETPAPPEEPIPGPEDLAVRQERIDLKATELQPTIQELIDVLVVGVTDTALKSGAIERELARSRQAVTAAEGGQAA